MGIVEDTFDKVLNTYKIKDAYERWADYRERVTDYLIKYITPGKTVALLGIGEANDIDLKRLYTHCGNLTLVDKDLDAMRMAAEKYELTGKPDICLVQKDFVGISDDEYKEIIEVCCADIKNGIFSSAVTAPKIIEMLDKLFGRTKDIDLGIAPHDYVIAIGLTSQLYGFITHIWELMLNETGKTDFSVFERCARQNDEFIPKFCEALEKATSERLFVGVETLEARSGSGIEGAIQAYNYFKDKTKQEDFETGKMAIFLDAWPLLEGVTYQMAIINERTR